MIPAAVVILFGNGRDFVQNNQDAARAGALPGHFGVRGLKFGAPFFEHLVIAGLKTDARHRKKPE